MSLEVFYDTIGGDLADVRNRLMTDERIAKFVGIFTQDPTFETLQTSLEAKDYPEAFRAAHTMKGLCGNLGFTALLDSSSKLTEALRPDDAGEPKALQDVDALMAQVTDDYEQITNAVVLID